MSSPASPLKKLSAAQRERLAYIEFRLWFLGDVTRKDVLERFGVATAAGTRDLALYSELAPQNAVYEGKRFHYATTFKPLFEHRVQRVLSALTSGFGDGERTMGADTLPNAVPERVNQPSLETLSKVTRAIHGGYPLKLLYHSMKTGAQLREIVPHALVDSGQRWHVRAFDRTKQEFRDLVLTRMERVTPLHSSPVSAQEKLEHDGEWGRVLNIDLVPHPRHRHPHSVEMDYGMRAGRLQLQLRGTVVGYVLRQLQVDCSPEARLDPVVYRLKLADVRVLAGLGNAVLAPGFVTNLGAGS